MPEISHSRERLDSVELYPFKKIAEKGIGGIMVSHLYVPALDSTPGLPASLSPKAIKEVLRKEIGYNGMVFTDAMNMGGIVKYFSGNEADVRAILAGNDMIMFPTDVNAVIEKIKLAIKEGTITETEIDEACRRVLLTKARLNLDKPFTPISNKNVFADLNNTSAKLMQQRLVVNALTFVKNQDSLLPIKHLDSVKIASIDFGGVGSTEFQKRLKYYANVDNFVYELAVKPLSLEQRKKKFGAYDIVILGLHGKNQRHVSKKYGMSDETIKVVDEML